jgi:hypothetical protein
MVSARVAAAGLLLLGLPPAVAENPVPVGGEFKVNSFSSRDEDPEISGDGNGGFVVVWSSYVIGASDEIYGQRFDASGKPQGGKFHVNTHTRFPQDYPDVAMGPSGQFVVAWQGSFSDDTSHPTIWARRYDAAGVPQGPPFLVSHATRATTGHPSVAIDGAGNFVVAWQGYAEGDAYFGVSARAFDASGNPRGPDFPVSVDIARMTSNESPAVALEETSGAFVVVWRRTDPTSAPGDLLARRFDAEGQALGAEVVVATQAAVSRRAPAVAADDSGAFVVAWDQDQDVFARRFDAEANPASDAFRVHVYTGGQQRGARVAVNGSGEFVVAWDSVGQDGSAEGVFARAFAADGIPEGEEFQANVYTTGIQHHAAVGVGPAGSFLVVWAGSDHALGDGPGHSVLGRRFGPDAIFADGFESGDLTAWSAAQTDGTDLAVSPLAAMASTPYGLRAAVDDRSGLYVQDDSPRGESRYRARFYVDPSGFDPGEAGGRFRTRIFLAFEEAPMKRLIQVVLRRQAGQYSLAARLRRDDDTRVDTGFSAITAAPHVVELEWNRASFPGADDGTFELWIDDTSVAALSGIDNDARSVDFVRLGALSVKDGASGTLSFDEFVSRRWTFIGSP